jgi:tripartite-type tricarboxylate transporter receptor subunit TctC
MTTKRGFLLALAASASISAICPAFAEVYPARPITVFVPFAAGGPLDVVGRILGERIRGALGQSVILENSTGAGGTIGVGRVARAAPDGYTLVLGIWSTHVVNGAIYTLQRKSLLRATAPGDRCPLKHRRLGSRHNSSAMGQWTKPLAR